jgi:hypothetical protein
LNQKIQGDLAGRFPTPAKALFYVFSDQPGQDSLEVFMQDLPPLWSEFEFACAAELVKMLEDRKAKPEKCFIVVIARRQTR